MILAINITIGWEHLAMVAGIVLIMYSIWPVNTVRQGSLCAGGALMCVALLFGGASSAGPSGPVPYTPLPDDRVVPDSNFERKVQHVFTGTKAEAQILGAMAEQFADNLAFDGERAKPVIKTTSDLGRIWAELQRTVFLSESTPLRGKFAPIAELTIAELEDAGISTTKTTQLDPNMRAAAVRIWKQLATALSTYEGPA